MNYERLLHNVCDEVAPEPYALRELSVAARRRNEWRGELVVLAHSPGTAAWQRICDLLECALDRELDACLPWLTRLLDAHWPDGLRTLRAGWVADWCERGDARRVRLARAAHVEDAPTFTAVVEAPVFAVLRELSVGRGVWRWPARLPAELLTMFLRARHLRGLRRLDLHDAVVGGTYALRAQVDGWQWLTRLTHLTHLRAPLNATALASVSASLRALRVLDLHGAHGVCAGLETLVTSPLWRGLERLGLRQCAAGDDDAMLLAETGAPALSYLDLSLGRVTSIGVAEVLRSPRLAALERVRCSLERGRRDPRYAELTTLLDGRLDLRNFVPEWLGE